MPEPHQSRIFTFIGTRTNQLKNTCARGLRQLKVAVVWSGQILLYPFQLLAQTKIFQPQLTPPPSLAALPQPVSDINIEEALDLVEVAGYPVELAHKAPLVVDDWSFIDESLWNVSHGNNTIEDRGITYSPAKSQQITPIKPMIRGLSSLLIDRQIVLVTTENELLDILTTAQQQEIRCRIGIDLALDWYQWHKGALSGDSSSNLPSGGAQLLLTEDTLEREIPPQTLFERLTHWFRKEPQPSAHPTIQSENIRSNRQKSPGQLPPARYPFTPQPPQLERFLALPQLPPITESDPITDRDNSIDKIVTKLRPDWLKQLWDYYRDYAYIPPPVGGEIIYQPPQEFELIPIDPKPSKIIAVGNASPLENRRDRSEIQTTQASTNLVKKIRQNLEYKPDWIEAISEEVGYSQSLFSRFLAWLDRIFLAIENWSIELWHKISNRSSSH